MLNRKTLQEERDLAEGLTTDRTRESLEIPSWFEVLNEEDRQFLKRFLLSSGSLKDLAAEYGISYPTIRTRLDRLIDKVRVADDPKPTDPFHRKLRLLVADGELSPSLAKDLLAAHRAPLSRKGENHD
jgi:hypothetical protein